MREKGVFSLRSSFGVVLVSLKSLVCGVVLKRWVEGSGMSFGLVV